MALASIAPPKATPFGALSPTTSAPTHPISREAMRLYPARPRCGAARLQNFFFGIPNFLQIFGRFLQIFPNFPLAVLGNIKGLRGKKFGRGVSPNFFAPHRPRQQPPPRISRRTQTRLSRPNSQITAYHAFWKRERNCQINFRKTLPVRGFCARIPLAISAQEQPTPMPSRLQTPPPSLSCEPACRGISRRPNFPDKRSRA